MKIGKLPNEVLKEIILDKIKNVRPEVLLRPSIGEDCSVVDLEDKLCVLSSDPITGAVNQIGSLAVHVSCNDIASCGAEPLGLMVTILAPPNTKREEIEKIMDQLCHTANSINVEVLGGHTEITDAVNRTIISSTCVGKAAADRLISTSGALAGSNLVLTKFAGLEGTSILAHDFEDKLAGIIDRHLLDRAKGFIQESGIVTAMVGLLNAPRGTVLYDRLESEGRIIQDFSGSNTDFTINFIPKMNKDALMNGYRKIINTIYTPHNYYKRVTNFLQHYQFKGVRSHAKIEFRHIVALIKSLFLLGVIGKERKYFWKLILWAITKKPQLFPLAVTFSIYGFHFRRIFEENAQYA